QKLIDLSKQLRTSLTEAEVDIGRSTSQIIPIVLGENARALRIAEALQDDGFDVRAIRPPAVPAGSARIRVSVSAGLDESTLRRFASSATRTCSTLGSCSAVSS